MRKPATPEQIERRRAWQREYARRNAARLNEHVKARYYRRRADPEFRKRIAESISATRSRYPLARIAQYKIQNLVRQGKLPRASELSCVDCGKGATDYDHRDYTKPLDVEPTCRSCNRKRGPGYPYNQTVS